ncbi:MAG: Hsp20 family protein [Rubrivivax sp.]
MSKELDADKVSAELSQGVLRVRIPKAAHAQPRRVQVQGELDAGELAQRLNWRQPTAAGRSASGGSCCLLRIVRRRRPASPRSRARPATISSPASANVSAGAPAVHRLGRRRREQHHHQQARQRRHRQQRLQRAVEEAFAAARAETQRADEGAAQHGRPRRAGDELRHDQRRQVRRQCAAATATAPSTAPCASTSGAPFARTSAKPATARD